MQGCPLGGTPPPFKNKSLVLQGWNQKTTYMSLPPNLLLKSTQNSAAGKSKGVVSDPVETET